MKKAIYGLSIYACVDGDSEPSMLQNARIEAQSQDDLYKFCIEVERRLEHSKSPVYSEIVIAIMQWSGETCIGNTTLRQLRKAMIENNKLDAVSLSDYN